MHHKSNYFYGAKQEDMIILTYIDDIRRKWIFTEIEENHFHWQNVTVKNNGEWHINAEMYAERI
ncbi:hypothetical protein [Diplocloster hominis]|uniref:hypothetical protein n=1 Tax=Diplocloster hominis TaxID=3079010 RepID=UPI0031BAF490